MTRDRARVRHAILDTDPREPLSAAVETRARSQGVAGILVQVLPGVISLRLRRHETESVGLRAAGEIRVDIARDGQRERPGVAQAGGHDLDLSRPDLCDPHLPTRGCADVSIPEPRG